MIFLTLVAVAWAIDNLPLIESEHNNLMRFWSEIGCDSPFCTRAPVGTPCDGLRASGPGLLPGAFSGPACSQGRIVRLSIGSLVPALNGTFSAVIGTFDKLTTIEIATPWTTSARVPPEIGRLSALTLLNLRGVTGLPDQIGQLTSLTQLIVDGQFASNEPASTIPSTITRLTNLRSLQLSSMNLTGTVPDMSGMRASLNIGRNSLVGPLRVGANTGCIAVGHSNGRGVTLDADEDNCFSSCTPVDAPCCRDMPFLCPRQNKSDALTAAEHARVTRFLDEIGCFAPHCGRPAIGEPCRQFGAGFTCLYGSATSIAIGDVPLNGTMPAMVRELTGLTSLVIQSKSLRGAFTSDVTRLTRLQALHLAGVKGGIPTDVGDLTQLTSLVLTPSEPQPNSVPPGINNLVGLETLVLASNNLVGEIVDMSYMLNLKQLDISNNAMTGNVMLRPFGLISPCKLTPGANCFKSCVPQASPCCKEQLCAPATTQATVQTTQATTAQATTTQALLTTAATTSLETNTDTDVVVRDSSAAHESLVLTQSTSETARVTFEIPLIAGSAAINSIGLSVLVLAASLTL